MPIVNRPTGLDTPMRTLNSNKAKLEYRAEIDGLRAVAVLAVILFHAGYQSFGGGFVGVDVFFVISGYLITAIILKEVESGEFTITRFYERRVRRILPALYCVLCLTFPVAWLLLTPSQLTSFGKSVAAIAAFVPNLLFWKTSGYFDQSAAENPLLHTWSLGVEEQFYILFPVGLAFVARFGRKTAVASIGVAAFLSFLLSEMLWRNGHAMTGFYLAPSRAWELLLGSAVALASSDKPVHVRAPEWMNNLLSVCGAISILIAIAFFSEDTPTPSWYALAPTVGAALIIAFGSQKTWVGRLLSIRALVGIGLISYSAYLWHQPLYVFFRIHQFQSPTGLWAAALAFTSLLLAFLSWRFVERPFRDRKAIGRSRLFTGAGVATGVLFLGGSAAFVTGGFPSRFVVPAGLDSSFARSSRVDECREPVYNDAEAFCTVNGSAIPQSFAVYGDSHALALLPAFESAANQLKINGVFAFMPGCPPFLGVYGLRNDSKRFECYDFNNRVAGYVSSMNVEVVYLVGRWTYYTDGGYDGKEWSYIGLSPRDGKDAATSRNAFEQGLARTVDFYVQRGIQVYLINQVPQQLHDPKAVYYRAYKGMRPYETVRRLSVSKEDHQRLQQYVHSLFSRYNNPALRVLSLDAAFCDDVTCAIGSAEKSYYFDDDHLSVAGSASAVNVIEASMRHRPQ